jgi:hypothetical protein
MWRVVYCYAVGGLALVVFGSAVAAGTVLSLRKDEGRLMLGARSREVVASVMRKAPEERTQAEWLVYRCWRP